MIKIPKIPIYKDMYMKLKLKIENELYKKGTLLPSEEELQKEYNVSRTTVRKAIALLQGDGLIEVKQGYGTEILRNRVSQYLNNISSVSECLKHTGYVVGVRNMHIERIAATNILAEALHIDVGEPVILISRIQTADNAPITIAKNYIPEKYVPGITQEKDDIISLYKYLDDKYSIKMTKITDSISACNATFEEAIALEVEPKDALIIVRRACYSNNLLVEVDYVKIVANKYEYKNQFEE